jgi:hypothetical protein
MTRRATTFVPIVAVGVGALICGWMIVGGFRSGGLVTTSRAGAANEPAIDTLARARDAATGYDFTGEVVVTWRADGRIQRERVPVREVHGVLRVGDSREVISAGDDRLMARGDDWKRLWGEPTGAAGEGLAVVDPERKYSLVVTDGPRIAGRSTTLIEAERRGRVSERFAVDDTTGLLLRREQLDGHGRVVRAVGFVRLSAPIPTARSANLPTRRAEGSAPKEIMKSPPSSVAPLRLGRGFALTGRYLDTDGSVQLFYSDGIYSASLFEEAGRLDRHELPDDATATDFGGRRLTTYATPSGTVVVWNDDDRVYALVSDAPKRDLDAIVNDLPAPTKADTASEMAQFVLGPFRW